MPDGPLQCKILATPLDTPVLNRTFVTSYLRYDSATRDPKAPHVSVDPGDPRYIAIDVVSRLLYFAIYNKHEIGVMTLDGRYSFPVVTGISYYVFGMALHPARG